VIPRRRVALFADLTPEEVTAMWMTAQKVGSMLKEEHHADALTLAIQDGEAAGQSVPHCHIHVLPRHFGDFKRNDQVYDELDSCDVTPCAAEASSSGVGTHCGGVGTPADDVPGDRVEAAALTAGSASTASPSVEHLHMDDEVRRPRSAEEMAAEAARYRRALGPGGDG